MATSRLPRWIVQAPLIASLRELARHRERALVALYAVLLVVAAVAAAPLVSEGVVAALIANHQLRPRSRAAWIGLQLVPKMYSFAHTCWIGPTPILEQPGGAARFAADAFWVNHYPARRARFDAGRAQLGAERWVVVRTAFRGQAETATIHVQRRDDGLWLTPTGISR